MSRRAKIIISVILLVLVVILLFLWWRSRAAVPLPKVADAPNNQAVAPSLSGAPPAPLSSVQSADSLVNPAPAPRAGMEALARSFAERYGSYSNQSNFENIENLYPFMTSKMQENAQAMVAQERAKSQGPEGYAGVTTRALSVIISEQSSQRAKLMVKTQRTESGSALPSSRVYYQDLGITLDNAGGVWQVGEAVWK